MKVKECMCRDVCYCKPDTSITDVAKIMNEKHIGCVPVCNSENNVIGVLTDRDITLRTVACGKDCTCTDVSEIMTCNISCCDCNDDIEKVTKNMRDNGVRRIPVTQNGKLVGILTLGDLAKHKDVTCNCVGNTFEHICNCNNNKL